MPTVISNLPLFSEFINAFSANSSKTVVSSYKSYINKAVISLKEDKNYDLVQKLRSIESLDDLSTVKSIALMQLDDDNNLEKKIINNLKSGLRKYFSFLEQNLVFSKNENEDGTVNIPEPIEIPSTPPRAKRSRANMPASLATEDYITYTELYKRFKSRLVTDDRFQKESICIPMRLINNILRNCDSDLVNKYDEWVESLIDNTIILTKRGAVHLKNINGIKIERPYLNVYFRVDGVEPSRLFTYRKKGGKIIPIETYKINRKTGLAENLDRDDIIKKLSREHFPEASVMALSIDTPYKALQTITDICKKYGIDNGSKLQDAMTNNEDFRNDISSEVIPQDVYDDLLLIESNQSLTLMDSSMNIGKGGIKTK